MTSPRQLEQRRAGQALQSPPSAQQSGSLDSRMRDAQRRAAEMRAACDVLKGAPRSSADDPAFMDTFYKASRLHFIGTWKVGASQHQHTQHALIGAATGGEPEVTSAFHRASQR